MVALDGHALGLEEGDASAYGYVFEDHLLRHVSHREQSSGETGRSARQRVDTQGEAQTKRPDVLPVDLMRVQEISRLLAHLQAELALS